MTDAEQKLRELLSTKDGRESAVELLLGNQLDAEKKMILRRILREMLDELGDLADLLKL